MPYVELHARSAFSFLRGASSPEQLAEEAVAQGFKAMALCDRNGVYGAPRFFSTAKTSGMRPIVGAEITMTDGAVLPVLVANRAGYQNLCRLITRAQLRAAKGESRVTWEEVTEFHDGLVALTGDAEGPLHRPVYRQSRTDADSVVQKLVSAFGNGNVYVELQRHFLQDDDRMVSHLVELAAAHGLPVLATNGVCYASKWGRNIYDIFTCARCHTNLDAAGTLLAANAERRMKSPAEMARLFADHPDALLNTERLADRLHFSLDDLGYEFPRYPVPSGETMDGMLRKLTFFGAQQRYGSITEPVRRQIEKELALIERLGFAGYFLVVWDIVNFAREDDILVQGRGSAANSAVCYSLGITAVDPVGGKLLFERFLSEGRKGWPDIDLDLPSGDRRERVIQEVFRRYGKHGAAMTANVITYRGRSAMREIGKALGFGEDVLHRFSSLFASGDFEHTLELEDQIVRAGIPREHERFKALVSGYAGIYGLPRHLGQHSGGMVISQHALDSIVPLENASMPGRVVIQWDKDDCEDLGIIKVDLLGLGMMAVLQDAVTLTHDRPGRGVDLAHIDKEDKETFALMQRADTIGTFQVESRAQMATLPRMKPACFYDVAIEVAIIRPGPIVGQMVHPYLARRNGEQEVEYIHPLLQPVLERTLGVPLFQEQMLRIAMVIADFNGDEAEELRRALSFHRSEDKMKRVIAKMRANMTRKGIEPDAQERVVQALGSFALYGFPESHAISFALLAYASCWLKVHRAPEFYCGLLNNQPMGFYSPATLMKDGKRHGVKFRPVCVARSGVLCRIEEDFSIRLGLNYVRSLHADKAAELVRQRDLNSFPSLDDLLTRVPLSKTDRRVLAKIGALNCLSAHRRNALWDAEAHFDQDDLFSARATRDAPLVAMSPQERLQADYDGTSVTTGPHPMSFARAGLPHVTRACDLPHRKHGESVTIAGVVICRQRPGTAKGHVFISLEDETGIANAIVRSELFEKLRLIITHETFLEIDGQLQHLEGVVSILTRDVRSLRSAVNVSGQSYDFH